MKFLSISMCFLAFMQGSNCTNNCSNSLSLKSSPAESLNILEKTNWESEYNKFFDNSDNINCPIKKCFLKKANAFHDPSNFHISADEHEMVFHVAHL